MNQLHDPPKIILPGEMKIAGEASKVRRGLVFAMILLGVLVFAAAIIAGCKSDPISIDPPELNGTDAIARADVRRGVAIDEIARARPETSQVGQQHLDVATTQMVVQGDDLAHAQAAVVQMAADKAQAESDRTRAQTELKDERDHYWGYKLRMAIRTIFWSALGIGAAVLALWFVAGKYAALLPIGHSVGDWIIHNLPLMGWFAKQRPVAAVASISSEIAGEGK